MSDVDDDRANSLVGTGLMVGSLMRAADSVNVKVVSDEQGLATPTLLVKFPKMGGAPAERGYLVTISIPPEEPF